MLWSSQLQRVRISMLAAIRLNSYFPGTMQLIWCYTTIHGPDSEWWGCWHRLQCSLSHWIRLGVWQHTISGSLYFLQSWSSCKLRRPFNSTSLQVKPRPLVSYWPRKCLYKGPRECRNQCISWPWTYRLPFYHSTLRWACRWSILHWRATMA